MRTPQAMVRKRLALLMRVSIAVTVISCSDDANTGMDDAGSASSGAMSASDASSASGKDADAPSTNTGASDAGGTKLDAAASTGGGNADASTNDGSTSSGAATSDSGASANPDAGSGTGSTSFTLTSPNHMDGAKFAPKYTCAEKGFNGSILPELDWTAGPAGTKSYALTFIDRTLADKGMANGYHWAIWNIPTSIMKLPEGMTNAMTVMAKQTGAFLGPCPNFTGSGKTDNYEFTLYALKSETVNISGGQTTAQTQNAEKAFEMDNLAKVKLKGTSDAKPPM